MVDAAITPPPEAMLVVVATRTSENNTARVGVRQLIRRALLATSVLMAPFFAATAAAESSVGESAVVIRDVEGTLQENVRKLDNADPVFQNELVATAERSASEIRFLDETSLTVGPGSSVVLDNFLYDPSVPSGTLVIGAAEGVFRFVSGKMPSDSYVIRTPEVTVGVRGTIIDFVARQGATAVVLQSAGSQAILTSKTGKTVTLNRPGQAAVAFEDGSLTPPGPPPEWALWKIHEMRSLIASVRSWTPPPRNGAIPDPTIPHGPDNAASYADNGFPQGDGAAAGAPGKAICIIC